MDSTQPLVAALADRYTISGELGRGGMAVVYLAEDVRHHRKVAIKVLRPELSAVIAAERFLKEIELTANLQHPHILPLFDSGNVDGLLYYVMPYVSGETLRSRLQRERQLPVGDALTIAREVADALQCAHDHGVVHRDIKPENILLQGGHALVADFGIALAVQAAGGPRLTQTGISVGTPHYMSPEQAMGDRIVDSRSDLFALGAVTYEMLAGEPPFTGPTVQAIVGKIMTSHPGPLRRVRETVSPATDEAIARALAKLPADRFASTRDFANALGSEMHSGEVAGNALASLRERNRTRMMQAIAACAVLAAAVAGYGWFHERRNTSMEAVLRVAIPMPVGLTVDRNSGRPVGLSLDGSKVIYGATDSSGVTRVYWQRVDDEGSVSHLLPGTENSTAMCFSPDGANVCFIANSAINRIEISSGRISTVVHTGSIGGLVWATNDEIVVAQDDSLFAVRLSTGAQRLIVRADTGSWAAPQVSPSGKYLFLLHARIGRQTQIDVVPMDGGTAQPLGVSALTVIGVVDNYLLFVNPAGVLSAIAFDDSRGTVSGAEFPLSRSLTFGGSSARIMVASNGTLLYVPRALPNVQMGTYDEHGKLTKELGARGRYSSPRFSPDEAKILASVASDNSSDIVLFDRSRNSVERLTTDGKSNTRPTWLSGGRMLFRSSPDGVKRVFATMSINRSDAARVVVTPSQLDPFAAAPAPDGKSFVFYAGAPPKADIWRASINGEFDAVKIVGDSRFTEFSPVISPDGHWLAYTSDEYNGKQVYIIPYPNGGAPVQVSFDGGEASAWSHDGTRLFFNWKQLMYVATLVHDPQLRVSGLRKMFSTTARMAEGYAGWDVTGDGKTFVMLMPEPQPNYVQYERGWLRQAIATGARGSSLSK